VSATRISRPAAARRTSIPVHVRNAKREAALRNISAVASRTQTLYRMRMNKRPVIRCAIAILPFIVLAIPCAAAGPGAAPQAAPPVGGGLVTVDFRVLGEGGAPIVDLKPADVSLKVGGARARCGRCNWSRSAAASSLPTAHPSRRCRRRLPAIAWPIGAGASSSCWKTRSIPAGREKTVKEAVGALLDGLSARDLVSLMIVSRAKIDVGSTTQHDRVRAVIDKFVGRAPAIRNR